MKEKEEFLRKINDAFSNVDQEFLLEHVSEDFCWRIVGERTMSGKIAFAEALKEMAEMPRMKIDVQNVITPNNGWGIVEGVVSGKNRFGQKKYFSFCDLYQFGETAKDQIQSMTSYVVDVSRHKLYKEKC